MDKTLALQQLKAIRTPVFIDGGYWQFGHVFFILTETGLITIDFKVYDPILGPIEYSLKEYKEIQDIAKECDTIAENSVLDPDEQLFLFNNGRPGVQYWAFQPYDNAPLEAYIFSADKKVIEETFIDKYRNEDMTSWESMDEISLMKWAQKII